MTCLGDQFSHHKTLEFQVFNRLVMLVGRGVNITVVQLDLVVEAVPEVLVVKAYLQLMLLFLI